MSMHFPVAISLFISIHKALLCGKKSGSFYRELRDKSSLELTLLVCQLSL